MRVGNVDKCLRPIAQLIAKCNSNFVGAGQIRKPARASLTPKSMRVPRGLRCSTRFRVTVARCLDCNALDDPRRKPTSQYFEDDWVKNVELRAAFNVELDGAATFQPQGMGEVPSPREHFEEDFTMPRYPKGGPKNFSKAASYSAVS